MRYYFGKKFILFLVIVFTFSSSGLPIAPPLIGPLNEIEISMEFDKKLMDSIISSYRKNRKDEMDVRGIIYKLLERGKIHEVAYLICNMSNVQESAGMGGVAVEPHMQWMMTCIRIGFTEGQFDSKKMFKSIEKRKETLEEVPQALVEEIKKKLKKITTANPKKPRFLGEDFRSNAMAIHDLGNLLVRLRLSALPVMIGKILLEKRYYVRSVGLAGLLIVDDKHPDSLEEGFKITKKAFIRYDRNMGKFQNSININLKANIGVLLERDTAKAKELIDGMINSKNYSNRSFNKLIYSIIEELLKDIEKNSIFILEIIESLKRKGYSKDIFELAKLFDSKKYMPDLFDYKTTLTKQEHELMTQIANYFLGVNFKMRQYQNQFEAIDQSS